MGAQAGGTRQAMVSEAVAPGVGGLTSVAMHGKNGRQAHGPATTLAPGWNNTAPAQNISMTPRAAVNPWAPPAGQGKTPPLQGRGPATGPPAAQNLSVYPAQLGGAGPITQPAVAPMKGR